MGANTLWAMTRNSIAFDGIQSARFSPGVQNLVQGGDGNIYNTVAAFMAAAPSMSIETVHIDQWLDAIGTAGLSIGATPLKAYFADLETYGARKATGLELSMLSGLIVPRQLTARQNSPAVLSVDVILFSTDGNSPITPTAAQNLPTAGTIDEWFTCGPVTIGGADVGDIQSITVDFGVNVQALSGDGDLYPSGLIQRIIAPRITFDTITANKADTIDVAGTSGIVVATFLKGAAGGRAGSGDKTVTTKTARVIVDELGATHQGEAVLRISCDCPSDNGTNSPLTIG